jgi:lipoprotein LprG
MTAATLRLLVATLALLLIATACSEGTTGTTLAPDASVILAASAEVMGDIDYVQFTIERGGAPIYIDPADALAFEDARGRFAGPSSADAIVGIKVSGLTTTIGAVAIDGETWLSNPITGTFEPAPEGYELDPATLFDPDEGWRPLLANGLVDVELVGLEERDAGELYHLRGTADRERIGIITAGLVDDQDVVVDIWIEPTTGYVREAEFVTIYRGDDTTWRLTFSEFGEPLEIDIPDLGGGS